ncbi:MAG: transcription antitermination factor NusB [Planctomycetia bacterium]
MKTPRRSRAREIAIQALYRLDMNPATVVGDVERFIEARLGHPGLAGFAKGLVAGVRERRGELDALLDGRADNWRVARMPATDRAILRMATFELFHGDVPGPVAVDEAIELAKRYGTADSARFVAGVLGRLLADRGVTTPAH